MKKKTTRRFTNFYDAWWFLNSHKAFERTFPGMDKKYSDVRFEESLDIYVPKVNPVNNTIDRDEKKNTKTVVWLECGKWMNAKELYRGITKPKNLDPNDGAYCHNPQLDCGADTFEEAIIKLANLVFKYYGNKKSHYA